MQTIPSPLTIAYEIFEAHDLESIRESNTEEVLQMIAEGIEADRKRRENDGTIHAAVIAALWDRADYRSEHGEPNFSASGAQWIEDEPDEFWEEFAGPMLDDIERKFR